MPEDACPCGSFAPFQACHGLLEAEYYRPRHPEWLCYRPPSTWTREMVDVIGRRYGDMGPYEVRVRDDRTWEFQLTEPLRFIRHYPAMRPADTGRLRIFRRVLENCNTWGDMFEVIAPERRQQAYERLRANQQLTRPEHLDEFQQDLLAVLACPIASDLPASVRDAGVFLLERFPQACVDLVWKDQACVRHASLLSGLARQQLMPIHQVKDTLFAERGPFGTWNLTFDPGPFFAVLKHIGYPAITGLDLFGVEFGFVIDYGAEVNFPSLEDLEQRLRGVSSWLLAGREDPSIRKFTTGLGSRHKLRLWLARRLNNLFAQLSYLGSFANQRDGIIQPVRQWKDLLTVRDIVSLTESLITTSNAVVMKLLFFDVIDRYRGLSGRGLKDLLSASFLLKKAVPAIDPELAEFREAIQNLIRTGWERVVEGLWDGIYSKTIRAGDRIVLGDGRAHTKEEFASMTLSALRNTVHGYQLKQTGEFDNVLAHHCGALPAAVRDLAIGLWFALLSKPSLFWGNRARMDLMAADTASSPTSLKEGQA